MHNNTEPSKSNTEPMSNNTGSESNNTGSSSNDAESGSINTESMANNTDPMSNNTESAYNNTVSTTNATESANNATGSVNYNNKTLNTPESNTSEGFINDSFSFDPSVLNKTSGEDSSTVVHKSIVLLDDGTIKEQGVAKGKHLATFHISKLLTHMNIVVKYIK